MYYININNYRYKISNYIWMHHMDLIGGKVDRPARSGILWVSTSGYSLV